MRANKHYEQWCEDYTKSLKRNKDYYGEPGTFATRIHLTHRAMSNNATKKLMALASWFPMFCLFVLNGILEVIKNTGEATVNTFHQLTSTD